MGYAKDAMTFTVKQDASVWETLDKIAKQKWL
jgi:hypothetical protein